MSILPILLALSLVSPLVAQEPTPAAITAQWRGAMFFDSDFDGPRIGSMTARLTITATTINGDWNTGGGASGQINGTIEKSGQIRATMTLFAGTSGPDNTTDQPERCRGEATFKGRAYASGVLNLTTDIIKLNTPSLRALNRDCEDMKHVVIRLMVPESQH